MGVGVGRSDVMDDYFISVSIFSSQPNSKV